MLRDRKIIILDLDASEHTTENEHNAVCQHNAVN